MKYNKSDRVMVRISAHTHVEGIVAARMPDGSLQISTATVGVSMYVQGDVVDGVVRPAPRDEEPTPEARLMAGAVWGIMRARLDETGRQVSDVRVSTHDGYLWAFTSEADAKREAAGLAKRYGRAGGGKREYRYSVTPFTLEEAAAAAAHGYALNGNHPDAPAVLDPDDEIVE